MPKFIVDYTEERWFSIEIEADTAEEADEKFWTGECDFQKAENRGGEIQQDIRVYEEEETTDCQCGLCGCGAEAEYGCLCAYCDNAHPDYHKHDCDKCG